MTDAIGPPDLATSDRLENDLVFPPDDLDQSRTSVPPSAAPQRSSCTRWELHSPSAGDEADGRASATTRSASPSASTAMSVPLSTTKQPGSSPA
jgi:hypothetical protein